ncbi:GL18256 [Drosophila persimilis]|uniref:Growth hormone-inducible transmembrane protein n=2 Tax=pseudoobscura subgroup TaxID=32358 RepID=B5DM07_DROPS|nr:growth hormone-inducible transmembrane protein [Drosophila persimilis]XP_002133896.1 growth hormone-inducible transmembrane protein [Drosophila pseudoobscura]EDW32683.1 GL18256 [Drosophila persimilis]
MLLRLALSAARPGSSLLGQQSSQSFLKSKLQVAVVRNYARGPVRTRAPVVEQQVRHPSLKEKLMGPPSANAYSMGKGAAAGAAVVGLGALCYYGVGLGKHTSIADNAIMWPEYVKSRIQSTYAFFGGSCILTAASAAAVFRSPRLLSLASRGGIMWSIASLALVIGSGAVARSIEYHPGIGPKHLAWAVHCAILGAVIAPLCFIGGPVLTRAALYTGGIVGGLSTIAACAPSDKFLYMGGPLAIGLGFVFASSLASMWLPPTTALGAGLASISLYGGLVLFSGFLLYDTQRMVRKAEVHPQYSYTPFDPINASMSIYLDVLNIFIRIATILSGGQRRK